MNRYNDSYFSGYDMSCMILVLGITVAIFDGILFAIMVLID